MTPETKNQPKQSEWLDQWTRFRDNERSLFEEWIAPLTLRDFLGKTVFEAGCGGGQHTAFIAPYAREVVAVDLNTADIARQRNKGAANVAIVEGDIAEIDLGRQFDVVLCIGVIQHTDDPDRTFRNLYRHVKLGGQVVVWAYSAEGNALVMYGVEPFRRLVLRYLPRAILSAISVGVTAALYPIVHSLYRVPALKNLPYYDYFRNFRRLSFRRNVLNVFDKLNAPQTHFLTRARVEAWTREGAFAPESLVIRPHLGVSWTLLGTRSR